MRQLAWMIGIGALWACGGQTLTLQGDAGTDGASSSSSSGSSSTSSSSGGSSSGSGGSSSSSGGGSGSSSGISSSSSSGGSSSGTDGGGRVPKYHRPDDSQCSTPAPPGTCSIGGSGGGPMCTSDSQCTDAGLNGRCAGYNAGPAYCACTYDACVHDSDCTGETCACHGSAYIGGFGNTCVPGNCHVDADCGPGGYCSPTSSATGCGGLGGYYCHTSGDQCIDDTDCGSSLEICAYSSTNSRWECQQQVLCE
jgi:hypothetical protein